LKVSGFTICRNGIRLGFPFKESIRSLAPLCDEIVIACGESEDSTLEELKKMGESLSCPLKILETKWDMTTVKGGHELARQTNLALDACGNELCFYLQGDEVLHEADYEILRKDLNRLDQSQRACSLLLQWVHFFGDQQSVIHSRRWYRKEIRVVKKSSGLRSYKDAQGFRKHSGSKWITLPTLESLARVYHYGWVRPPELMALKTNEFQHWWHGAKGNHNKNTIFRPQYGVKKFEGTHPAIMRNYLTALPKSEVSFYESNHVPFSKETVRLFLTDCVERLSGWRVAEFKNYSEILDA